MPKLVVIVNPGSGSAGADETKQRLETEFKAHDVDAEILIARDGEELVKLAKKAMQGEAGSIVAGGGDGTISAVAAELIGSDKILGVLPLGTLNHFSKDLKIPDDLAESVRIIAERNFKKLDVGEVNGRIFLNNSSIGLYPQIVRKRDQMQQRLGRGKWTAAFWAAWRVIRIAPSLHLSLKLNNKRDQIKTFFVFVGNNDYEMDLFNIGRRTSLDNGKLSVYFLRRGGRWGVVMLIIRTIIGRLHQTKDFEEILTEEITIETRSKKLLVAFDGEVDSMKTPLHYKIRPQALNVIVPAEKEEVEP